MGTQQQIQTGARAQLIINGKIRGIFTSVSWSTRYDQSTAFVLGAYAPVEITYTAQEPISISANGYRVESNGAYVVAELPKLQDLLNHEDIVITVSDRKTGKDIVTVTGVRPLGYSSAANARGVIELNLDFLGLKSQDDSGSQGESAGASTLLSGT